MIKITAKESKNEVGSQFFVGLDAIELLQEQLYEFRLDGVQVPWFRDFQNSRITEVYQKMFAYQFLGDFKREFFERFINLYKELKLSRWILINVVKTPTEYPISQFVENAVNPEEAKLYIESFIFLEDGDQEARRLDDFFSMLNFRKTEDSIEKALNEIRPHTSDFKLNVYNVGQGNLSAITDPENVPLMYYDVGGGWRFNHNTYPVTKRLCFSHTRTIVISHWDWDHLETARRYRHTDWNPFRNKIWIAPLQDLTPSYAQFAAYLADTGTLLLWPDTLDEIRFWGGRIIKCRGTEKNDSGLALLVESPSHKIQKVLHPADAAYKYIPGYNTIQPAGIVATHHGANFEEENRPLPTAHSGGYIAYSYANTRYGHPKADAVAAHLAAGWGHRLNTPNGDITFDFKPCKMNVPCGERNCDLKPIQTFGRMGYLNILRLLDSLLLRGH